jgi:hypothetical protein
MSERDLILLSASPSWEPVRLSEVRGYRTRCMGEAPQKETKIDIGGRYKARRLLRETIRVVLLYYTVFPKPFVTGELKVEWT